ncbi:hypothetical protein BB560_003087 [Smittium megazygosporum]|uniref:PH domain-containing protein n=1 Tax=Smittium megazygosporum TaxID=133381 RepID=A0A2T9ZCY5_9FUNG|nr:hypothetical protein BB560_003087 [Smittium megazygosporum]
MFSKSLKKTFTTKLSKRSSNSIPHEFISGSPQKQSAEDASEKESPTDTGNSVGSGDLRDLIFQRYQTLKRLVKIYILYFDSVNKSFKNMTDSYTQIVENFKITTFDSYLMLPSGSQGYYDCVGALFRTTQDQLTTTATSGFNLTKNTSSELEGLRQDIKSRQKEYSDRVSVLYSNLSRQKQIYEGLKTQLAKGIELSKLDSEALKAGDPFLINNKIKVQVSMIADTENSLYNAVQMELKKLEDYEKSFTVRFNGIISNYLSWTIASFQNSIPQFQSVNERFVNFKTDIEISAFKEKYAFMLANPQSCDGKSDPSNITYPYMDSDILKVVKAGIIKREDISLGSSKYRECQAILTSAGFLHLYDVTSGIQKVDPNVSIYVPSATLAPLDSPDLPRSDFMLYTSKHASKHTSMAATFSGKSKFILRGSNYDDMKDWWVTLSKISKDVSIERFGIDAADLNNQFKSLSVESPQEPKHIEYQDDRAGSVDSSQKAIESDNKNLAIEQPAERLAINPPPQSAAAANGEYTAGASQVPLMIGGTQAIGYSPGTNQPLAYHPVTQPDGQVVYVPLVQNAAVEEPVEHNSASSVKTTSSDQLSLSPSEKAKQHSPSAQAYAAQQIPGFPQMPLQNGQYPMQVPMFYPGMQPQVSSSSPFGYPMNMGAGAHPGMIPSVYQVPQMYAPQGYPMQPGMQQPIYSPQPGFAPQSPVQQQQQQEQQQKQEQQRQQQKQEQQQEKQQQPANEAPQSPKQTQKAEVPKSQTPKVESETDSELETFKDPINNSSSDFSISKSGNTEDSQTKSQNTDPSNHKLGPQQAPPTNTVEPNTSSSTTA